MSVRKQLIAMAALFMLIQSLLVGVQADDKKPTVMFDQGHGQKFLIEKEGDLQLSKLSALFKNEGYLVKTGTGLITDDTMKGVSVLVISGAFVAVNPAEIEAILRFLDGGGSLCIMLHIPHPLTGLMSRLRVFASNGVILEKENLIRNEPKDFFITKMDQHPITKGIEKIGVHGGWALISDSAQGKIIARTSQNAWIDLNRDGQFNSNDASQSFGVAIAGTYNKGQYVIFGDDAIFQNIFLEKENMALGNNLVKWLRGS
ncbi:MAG: hypothetical protein AMK74_00870 [Nitrospira bacterium SM23_35]|nr:MAG: hypothetical protein AMK74_00870 [Nitrospira bacterium SM23_35]